MLPAGNLFRNSSSESPRKTFRDYFFISPRNLAGIYLSTSSTVIPPEIPFSILSGMHSWNPSGTLKFPFSRKFLERYPKWLFSLSENSFRHSSQNFSWDFYGNFSDESFLQRLPWTSSRDLYKNFFMEFFENLSRDSVKSSFIQGSFRQFFIYFNNWTL